MSPLLHLRRAIGWFLIALLATTVLSNLIGFVSPFWGHLRAPGDASASRDLLHAWQPVSAALSLLYLMPAWHLSRTCASALCRCGVLVIGALVPASKLLSFVLERSEGQAVTPAADLLAALVAVYPPFAFLVFTVLVWRVLRRPGPTP